MSFLSALTDAVTLAISAPTIVPVKPPEAVIVVVPAEKSIPMTSFMTLLPACVDEESVPFSARTPVSGAISPNNKLRGSSDLTESSDSVIEIKLLKWGGTKTMHAG